MAGMGDGSTVAPVEYVHQLRPLLRDLKSLTTKSQGVPATGLVAVSGAGQSHSASAQGSGLGTAAGLDVFVWLTRTPDAYYLAVRVPTTLTAQAIETSGGYGLSLYTASQTEDGRRVKTLVLHVPANWPLGQRIALPGGPSAVRSFDRQLSVMVIELALPEGTVATDRDGNPLMRFELTNLNASAGAENVGSQTFPQAGDPEADELGLGRLPADPLRAAMLELLGEFDAQARVCPEASGRDLDNLLMRSTLAQLAIKTRQWAALRHELDDLVERIEWLGDERRLPLAEADSLRERIATVRRLVALVPAPAETFSPSR